MQAPTRKIQIPGKRCAIHELQHARQAFRVIGANSASRTGLIEAAKAFVLKGFDHGGECKAIHYTRCGIYVPHLFN